MKGTKAIFVTVTAITLLGLTIATVYFHAKEDMLNMTYSGIMLLATHISFWNTLGKESR